MKHAPSLLRQLVAWTLGALAVVWAAFIAIGYGTGLREADELTDGHLASVASVLFAQRTVEFTAAPNAAQLGARGELRAHDYQQSLSIVVWDGAGRVLARSGGAPTPPFDTEEGFRTIEVGQPAAPWRSFSRWDGPARARKITVMLSLAERDALAEDIAEQVATPGLWLLPVVALVLGLALRRGVEPLFDFSGQVNAFDIHQDTSLEPPRHREFSAIAASINSLVGRYKAALARERELASEVAHELRTPLASLQLHANSLQQGLAGPEREQALAQVRLDAERAGSVLNDLLALARASRTEMADLQQEVDLAELARRVAAECWPRAIESGHDLSVDAPDACRVHGHPVLLELALRNLIENALAHTRAGTSVQVRVTNGPPALEVHDDGAGGEPPATPGGTHLSLGLGHQVVRKVAAVHGGHFEAAENRTSGRTYRVVLRG